MPKFNINKTAPAKSSIFRVRRKLQQRPIIHKNEKLILKVKDQIQPFKNQPQPE